MNGNALETMIVPAVRGVFLVVMLGAAARGLVRMIGVVAASARHPDDSVADLAPAALAARADIAAEADRLLQEETLSAGLA
ncbi:MAG TPA: hypothetical protein VGH33_07670 [Isosphaeraceae bacterium]|jgi:hypothetical protein